jgi:predicted transcriptional regulator
MKLKAYRLKRKLTQDKVAQAIGVSTMSVCRYEHGEKPSPDVMERIWVWSNGAIKANDWFDLPSKAVSGGIAVAAQEG